MVLIAVFEEPGKQVQDVIAETYLQEWKDGQQVKRSSRSTPEETAGGSTAIKTFLTVPHRFLYVSLLTFVVCLA